MSAMVTVKRNSVYIVFPEKAKSPIKGEVIENEVKRVSETPKQLNKSQIVKRGISTVRRCVRGKSSIVKVGKRCMRCGDFNCFYGSSYCWDCYKYEHYESK